MLISPYLHEATSGSTFVRHNNCWPQFIFTSDVEFSLSKIWAGNSSASGAITPSQCLRNLTVSSLSLQHKSRDVCVQMRDHLEFSERGWWTQRLDVAEIFSTHSHQIVFENVHTNFCDKNAGAGPLRLVETLKRQLGGSGDRRQWLGQVLARAVDWTVCDHLLCF